MKDWIPRGSDDGAGRSGYAEGTTMTQQKNLKKKIRARMEKTGEPYTEARRHFLTEIAPASEDLSRVCVCPEDKYSLLCRFHESRFQEGQAQGPTPLALGFHPSGIEALRKQLADQTLGPNKDMDIDTIIDIGREHVRRLPCGCHSLSLKATDRVFSDELDDVLVYWGLNTEEELLELEAADKKAHGLGKCATLRRCIQCSDLFDGGPGPRPETVCAECASYTGDEGDADSSLTPEEITAEFARRVFAGLKCICGSHGGGEPGPEECPLHEGLTPLSACPACEDPLYETVPEGTFHCETARNLAGKLSHDPTEGTIPFEEFNQQMRAKHAAANALAWERWKGDHPSSKWAERATEPTAAHVYGDGKGPDGTGSIDEDTPCNCGDEGDPRCLFHHPLTSVDSGLYEKPHPKGHEKQSCGHYVLHPGSAKGRAAESAMLVSHGVEAANQLRSMMERDLNYHLSETCIEDQREADREVEDEEYGPDTDENEDQKPVTGEAAFFGWLRTQSDRDDRVGDLANDWIAHVKAFGSTSGTVASFRVRDETMREAMGEALLEFKQFESDHLLN